MIRAIFIHPKPSFLERIQKESEGKALTTTSMIEALKWISNPIQHLSGLYLNPDDTSFSALHFIDLVLTHRPSLPIFLLESKLAQNKPSAERITNSTHIRGVFSGSESYSTLIGPLKVNVASDLQARPTPPKMLHPGYVTLPVSDFFTGSKYPFDIFISTEEGDIRLFAPKNGEIDPNYLGLLAKKNPWVLVREGDINDTRLQVQSIKSKVSENPDIPMGWKTSEVMVEAKSVVDDLKKTGVSENLVQYTQSMLKDLYSLISSIDSDDEGDLCDVIDRAKKCDRAVFCASYAVLICKQMRFEKVATLEILGFASVLQDVSLYQTPYGDLSEKSTKSLTADELQYYYKHPVLSSDLVAHHTDVPQVTLQVIRQHHERKNKTGFPNKVGGSQLHAMAEILSLINTYYDLSKEYPSDSDVIQQLNRNVFPNYSEGIVVSFKQVLGNVLKDKMLAAQTHTAQTGT